MGGRPTHKPDEMVIFFAADCIKHDISNQFTICFASCIKTETDFNKFVFKVSVYGLWAPYYSSWATIFLEVLSKQASISIWIIATNYNKTIKLERLAMLERFLELFFGFNFMSSRLDHIKTPYDFI